MDGFGFNPSSTSNAIQEAHKPNLDQLFSHYPFTTIQPGGEAVGLPKGVAGNSEVGHLNLGAGRPVRQDLVRINESIELNQFENLPRLNELIKKAQTGTKRIHLMGLLSDGGVHSHIKHLKIILKILTQYPELKIFLHAFMDGRDTGKNKGIEYVRDILTVPGFTFSSMQGRSIGMDRDRRWEKIELAYKTITGRGSCSTKSPINYILDEYNKNIFDEFITPVLFAQEGSIQEGDCVFFFNYRPDRAKQITLAFNDKNFKEFSVDIKPSYYLCMTPYIPDECPDLPVLFDKEKIRGGLAEYISKIHKKQFKIAETEKYAHVTYFFNGGEETPFQGEERCLVPSPREVTTYDEKPEMSAQIVTEKLVEKLADSSITLYVVNFANPDMVGHTGNFEAAVKAIEALDSCIGKIAAKCADENITMILTADHGNADVMKYEDGSPHTSHSDSLVPFCVVHPQLKNQKLDLGQSNEFALKDVAPTIIHILNLPKPESFSGNTIFL
jgi:2,3-bisphosphoglycerate-independent phosphoglycerate mutase